MITFAAKIRALAEEAENDVVKQMLQQAADIEHCRPKYRAAKVRVKRKDCMDCPPEGVMFHGSERVTPSD